MLKQTLTFVDFDGQQKTETHYFNLSKAEIIEMELVEMNVDSNGLNPVGGFVERVRGIANGGKGREIMKTFKEIIKKAYGIRSEDGRRFIKSEQISEEFLQTEAYSTFFTSLVMDADAAANFINEIVPRDLAPGNQPEARADGRPALSDHLPKQQKPETSAIDNARQSDAARQAETNRLEQLQSNEPIELRTVSEPTALSIDAGPSGQEMKADVITQDHVNELAKSLSDRARSQDIVDPSHDEGYQEYLRARRETGLTDK